MTLHEVQEGIGETGKLGEGFIALGLLGAIGGGILVGIMLAGGFTPWSAGEAVETDALITGALFLVMGIGFTVFGVMIVLAGWARQHPGYDEHGLHPTDVQEQH